MIRTSRQIGVSKGLTVVLVVLGAIVCLLAPLDASGLAVWGADRQQIDQKFRERLTALAAKCEELGLAEQARVTRNWYVDRDPGRQYLYFVDDKAETPAASAGSDLIQKWSAKFTEIRKVYAAQLFDAAQQEAEQGSATRAYQTLHEVLYQDPSHPTARRILNAILNDDERPRARSMRLVHPQFGWQRGRWWQIDSRHFQVVTDHSADAGVELARQLEEFHSLWQQLFFEYWTTRAWLKDQLAGNSPRRPPEPKHKVVLFRDRQEYIDRLSPSEPQIAVTLGYYQKRNRTTYFYAGDDASLAVRYHEATHQLFQENGEPLADVGEKWNFWIVEGIAVYMESLTRRDGYYTVGGFDADRLQYARSRVLGGEPQMPLEQLVALSREGLQKHPDIRKLYTQSAAVTHFLMDFESGRYRESLVQYLNDVYLGKDSPRTLFSIRGLTSPEFETDLKAFLKLRDEDLRYLGPPHQRRNLSLLGGSVTDESMDLLADSPRLEWLDLSLTGITNGGLLRLAKVKSLKRLSLVGVNIDDRAATTLAGFPELEELDVSGTGITDHALATLAGISKLKVLRLANTSVTDQGVAKLGSCKQLEELDVEATSVTPEALARLRKQLPNLKE